MVLPWFMVLPSSSALWRRLPFYHAVTCFSACIIKTGLLQCGAVWTSVYDTRSVAASSQCCSPSRCWSWTSGPRDQKDEGAPLVTNQIPYQFVSYVWWCTPLWLVNARNTFVILCILCQHYLDGIGFEQLPGDSSTSPVQELFSVKELSLWLVNASGTLFHKTLQTSQIEKLLNELLRHIILN